MPFPESERVEYKRNPLHHVICQLRFSPILRIEAQPPVQFQDCIREHFPLFEEVSAPVPNLNLPDPIAKLVQEQFQAPTQRSYSFQSRDKRWQLGLSRSSISLTDRAYTLWEDFEERLQQPVAILETEYAPAFYLRIGLRYQNLIQRSRLELSDVDWDSLFHPHVSAEFSSSSVSPMIDRAVHDLTIRLQDEQGFVHLRHGLAEVEIPDGEPENCYLLDADFFNQGQLERDNAFQLLKQFNRKAARLFRWCITDQLHEAMGPKPITD